MNPAKIYFHRLAQLVYQTMLFHKHSLAPTLPTLPFIEAVIRPLRLDRGYLACRISQSHPRIILCHSAAHISMNLYQSSLRTNLLEVIKILAISLKRRLRAHDFPTPPPLEYSSSFFMSSPLSTCYQLVNDLILFIIIYIIVDFCSHGFLNFFFFVFSSCLYKY